jgi:hypothetical protein
LGRTVVRLAAIRPATAVVLLLLSAYLEWLNRTIAVATAERKARRVLLSAYKLL